VVVVDNASTQDVAAALPDDPRVHLLHEPVPGSYAARNTGLGVARGRVLAFTDADCLPDPTWLERAEAALEAAPPADLVGGAIELFYADGRPRTAAELYEHRHGFPQERYLREDRFAATANMVTRRSVVDRVGPFDARLRSRGDAEFGQRVAAAGGLLRWAPDAVVRHPARSSSEELLTKFRRTSEGTRDADRLAGAGRVHFARLVLRQGWLTARTVGALLRPGARPSRLVDKARYMGLYLRLRWLQVEVYGAAALAPRPTARTGPR
jgi:GT2 family glycosyltransferase